MFPPLLQVALLLAPVSSPPRCEPATSSEPAELTDGLVHASFGPGNGALTSLRNMLRVDSLGGEELLASVDEPEGNPFRLVLAPQRLPPAANVTGAPYGDPSYADSPWPDGALGGTFADARDFQMISS
eukprot:SAG31_NODE_19932_length_588_cov_0.832311_1_plen_127_part_01